MPLFEYQAFAKNGTRQRGTIDAPSQEAAREMIIKNDLYPTEVRLLEEGERQSLFARIRSVFSRVSLKDKVLFTKQLAVLLKAGVPLLQALDLLIEQFEGTLHSILISVRDDVREGKSLADGLRKFPKVFDNIYIQLVRAGEASGKLEVILDRLTEFMERRQEITKRIKSALTTPMIQLFAVVVVVIVLLTMVLPNIVQTFISQGAELPFATRMLMGMSNLIRSYWLIILAVLILLIIAFRFWKRTPSGARTMMRSSLKFQLREIYLFIIF